MASKVPEIRFAGFEGDWCDFTLSTFADRITRKNDTLESDLVMTISAHHGLISQSEFFNKRIASTNLRGYYLMKNGEFTYNKSYSTSYPWGAVKRLDRYDKGVVSNLYIVFEAHDIESDFLVTYYDTNKWHKEVAIRAKEGARNHGLLNISADDFLSSSFVIPKESHEQEKIGELFSELTSQIATQIIYCEKLRNLKASLLVSLLPQGEETKPRIRLNGFTEAWTEKNLDEIITPYKEIVETPHDGYDRLGIRSHGKGTFHSYVPKGAELETAQMGVVRPNNLIVNITFGWELAVAITEPSDEGKLVSHRFPQFSFKEKNVPIFFRYALINNRFKKHLTLASPGSAGRNRVLKIDKMLEYKMLVPSEKEQKAISDVLSGYDRLIQLNEQKLEKLRNLKRAMLDKMFV